jgi:vacuolar-type H+-ATPase subunit E/Vma4
MSLDSILTEIEDKKRKSLQSALDDFNHAKEAKEKAYNAELDELKSSFEKKKTEEAESVQRSRLDTSMLEARRILTNRKNELVQEMLNNASTYFTGIRKREIYPTLLQKMVLEVERAFPQGGRITVNEKDKDLVEGMLKSENITVVKGEIDGGLQAVSKDGSLEIDLSLSYLWQDIRERIALAISENIGE